MKKEKVIEYAIIGINALIEDSENTIRKGRGYLDKIEKGEPVKTDKSISEIKRIIREHQAKIEKLQNEKFELDWETTIE